MLSYIHAYHAGNHADILKHIVFSLVLEHLSKKEKPYCVIDAHSAAGKYKIQDERLLKTGEARDGIEKLLGFLDSRGKTDEFRPLEELQFTQIARLYLKNSLYPGSPELAKCFLRQHDELILNELHPAVIGELKKNMREKPLNNEDFSAKTAIHCKNAKEFLNMSLPPKIRRGCVLIDPSYEDTSDFSDVEDMFLKSYKKWKTGQYIIWYPLLKHRAPLIRHLKETVETAVEKENPNERKVQHFELEVKKPCEMTGLSKLYGSGVITVNPPFLLKEKMDGILPLLKQILTD